METDSDVIASFPRFANQDGVQQVHIDPDGFVVGVPLASQPDAAVDTGTPETTPDPSSTDDTQVSPPVPGN